MRLVERPKSTATRLLIDNRAKDVLFLCGVGTLNRTTRDE